jgi:hypothetical protein
MEKYPRLVPAEPDGDVAYAARGRALGIVFQISVDGAGEMHSADSSEEIREALLAKARTVMDAAVAACGYDWAADGFHPSEDQNGIGPGVHWHRRFRTPDELLGR